jgi:hypothetical protein
MGIWYEGAAFLSLLQTLVRQAQSIRLALFFFEGGAEDLNVRTLRGALPYPRRPRPGSHRGARWVSSAPQSPPKAASSKPAAAGKPLHLLQYDERTKKFELGAEALDALRKIRGDVGVLAVCGRARQGKSYILNQLCSAGNEAGFKVGPTVRPCTKGLWIWSAPIERIDPVTGKRFHVILLDTEGIDAYDQTGQYSTQIFSMAVLLSSLFCYNQMGGIDEAALDRLSLVTEMTKTHPRSLRGQRA